MKTLKYADETSLISRCLYAHLTRQRSPLPAVRESTANSEKENTKDNIRIHKPSFA